MEINWTHLTSTSKEIIEGLKKNGVELKPEDKQLIISTQSVELINEMEAENIIVVDQEQGKSTFKRFGQEELSEWLNDYSLGELWKRNVLGGRP